MLGIHMPGYWHLLCPIFLQTLIKNVMKSIKQLMMLSLTIFTIAAYSQEKVNSNDSTVNKSVYSCSMHPSIVSNQPGKCSKCGMSLNLSPKEKMKMEVMKTFSCPMKCEGDKSYNKAGKCPKCGMSLKENKLENNKIHKH